MPHIVMIFLNNQENQVYLKKKLYLIMSIIFQFHVNLCLFYSIPEIKNSDGYGTCVLSTWNWVSRLIQWNILMFQMPCLYFLLKKVTLERPSQRKISNLSHLAGFICFESSALKTNHHLPIHCEGRKTKGFKIKPFWSVAGVLRFPCRAQFSSVSNT